MASTDMATIDSSQRSATLDATNRSGISVGDASSFIDSSGRTSHSSRRASGLDGTARPLEPERARSTRMRVSEGLQCANLRFGNLHVVGRERELAELREALSRARGRGRGSRVEEEVDVDRDDGSRGNAANGVAHAFNGADADQQCGKELVLISGVSGCGKSRLASTLAERVEKGGGLYVQGKYDLYLRDEPYFGISQAFGEIIGHILRLNESGDEADAKRFVAIRDALASGFDDEEETYLLSTVVSPIIEILGDNSSQDVHSGDDASLSHSKVRFNYILRKFVRIITSDSSAFGKPLVMVLDDLQWADAASLELLELLLTDRESSGLMIVGCYRSEEVTDSHALSTTIDSLREKMETQRRLNITQIHLDQLSLSDVNAILMELLSIDDADKTMALAELCHRRSMGNAFHLMTFLRLLQDERLLVFSVGSFSWTFDVESIERKTSAASNVVDIVTARLAQLPTSTQEALQIAACIGSSFESELLRLVWDEMRESKGSVDQLDIHLETAAEYSILESEADSLRYRWAHDKVQEAAMMLGQDGVQFRVGLILLAKFNEKQVDESVIFIIANLLQCGDLSNLDDGRREAILWLNLQAATKAVSCSAFVSATKYVKNGVALLPPDAFAHHYDLALELFSLGAQVEGFAGNEDLLNAYCEEVVTHAKQPLDKIRCYTANLSWLGTTMRSKLACELCFDILNELGSCSIPRKPLSQKINAILALRKVKDVETEVLQSLPLMTDPILLATMRVLDKLASFSNLSGNTFALILATYHMYRFSLSHGLCPLSSCAFASLAAVRNTMGNFHGGRVFADQALLLLARFDSKPVVSRTYFLCHFIGKPWTTPFLSGLKYLQESYIIGLQCGDTESGGWGITMYMVVAYLGGTNLNSVVSDMRTYLPQVRDFGRGAQVMMITIYFQACLCFMGLSSSEDPTKMSGEAIPNAEAFEATLRSLPSKFGLLVYQIQQSFLCALFGEHERGSELALERGDTFFRLSAANPQAMLDTFTRGISLFDMARRTKRRTYKRAAKKTLLTLRKWAKADNPNVINKLALLEAEQYALDGKRDKATRSYEKAITLSLRCGMLPDAGLASERYGELLLNDIRDKDKAVHFLEKAVQCYRDWGAAAKVHQMNEKYAGLWTVPHRIELKVEEEKTENPSRC